MQRVITDLCVADVTPALEGGGLRLVEFAPGVTDGEVREATEPPIDASPAAE